MSILAVGLNRPLRHSDWLRLALGRGSQHAQLEDLTNFFLFHHGANSQTEFYGVAA